MSNHDELLPWDRAEIENLVNSLLTRGEGAKIDFKRQLNISTAAEKGELLKDIAAIANTFDPAHRDHGFMILGSESGTLTYTTFDTDEDHLQARLDDLVKHNIQPFVQTKLFLYGQGQSQYGVIVIPPTRNAPHVFVREIEKFKRGDIYVRRGTVTDKAQPNDFARFYRQHLDEYTYQFQVQLRELGIRMATVEGAPRHAPNDATRTNVNPVLQGGPPDLLAEVDRALGSVSDPVEQGLIHEAARIREFLRSDAIPWAPRETSKEDGDALLRQLADVSRRYSLALGRIGLRDNAGAYNDAVVKSIAVLCDMWQPPGGTTFNRIGVGLRYVPLALALHVVFVAAMDRRKGELLKRVSELRLEPGDDYRETLAVGEALFLARQAGDVFQTQNPDYPRAKWCDPLAEYLRPLVAAALEGNDPLFRIDRAYLIGEFTLSLLPLVASKDSEGSRRWLPAPGSYLYYTQARTTVPSFLRDNRAVFEMVFGQKLKAMLVRFDEVAERLVGSGCWGEGFVGGAAEAIYPQASNVPTK